MARLPWRRQQPTADTIKAAPNLPAGAVAVTDITQIIAAVGQLTGQHADRLPQDTAAAATPFGPGLPVSPAPINAPRRDSGRPEPRLYDYPVSANLPGSGQRLLPWKILRDAADNVPLVRRCIEIRKAHIANAEWAVRVSKRALKRAQAGDGAGVAKQTVEQQLRDRLADDIAAAETFLSSPDRGNGLKFGDWLGQVIEEHFVLDAVAIYPRRTLGGKLFSLEVLDGSTIKPLLDARGGRPLPPLPAYQQILHGFPRGEFVASVQTEQVGDSLVTTIPGAYRSDELVYSRRNVRTFTPYGFSSVEQSLFDAETWLRRLQWIKSEYTDGVMPSGWLLADPTSTAMAGWSPAQLAEYERGLNDYLSGDTAARHRFKLLPPGLAPQEQTNTTDKYKPDYDLFLLKLVASHFDVTPAELGFMESGGLGGASFHEGQEDVQDRKGTRPLEAWLAGLITDLLHTQLDVSPDLEFVFLGEESEDEAAADLVIDARVRGGRMTLNESRDATGLPRYTFPEADTPMLMTQTAAVPLEGIVAAQQQQQEDAHQVALAGAKAKTGDDTDDPSAPPAKPASPPAAKPSSRDKLDEVKALRKYAQQREGRTGARDFLCKALTDAELDGFTANGVLSPQARALAKGADARGRDDRPAAGGLDGLAPLRAQPEPLLIPYRPGV